MVGLTHQEGIALTIRKRRSGQPIETYGLLTGHKKLEARKISPLAEEYGVNAHCLSIKADNLALRLGNRIIGILYAVGL